MIKAGIGRIYCPTDSAGWDFLPNMVIDTESNCIDKKDASAEVVTTCSFNKLHPYLKWNNKVLL